jgi:hypothetical protein
MLASFSPIHGAHISLAHLVWAALKWVTRHPELYSEVIRLLWALFDWAIR